VTPSYETHSASGLHYIDRAPGGGWGVWWDGLLTLPIHPTREEARIAIRAMKNQRQATVTTMMTRFLLALALMLMTACAAAPPPAPAAPLPSPPPARVEEPTAAPEPVERLPERIYAPDDVCAERRAQQKLMPTANGTKWVEENCRAFEPNRSPPITRRHVQR